ncbi:pyridoxamine 5'-phosphate oxidase family protein [Haloarculaceae archaeon H-GB11]|nr:pyridoxamine 5'-phosphate oxidase family protein [Haloarculaceae archaeon H-GB11]
MEDVPEEAVALLTSEPLVAHLGTCRDGRPHVAPLWYVLHDDAVEITTTGRKLANLEANDRVAMSVQKDVDGHPRWGVVLRGTASVVDGEDGEAIHRRINRRYGADEDAWSENTPVRIDVGSVDYWRY